MSSGSNNFLMMWLRLVTAFVLVLSYSLDAQQLVTAYSVDQGLPQSTVSSLYRDNDGYLWCGTGSGLGLYDGWEFHTPKQSGEKTNPALNSIIRGIIPSSDGKTIWVGTESTVNQFDRFNYRLLRSFNLVKKPGIAECPVIANDTAVWITCCGAGLFRVRLSDGKATQLTSGGYEGKAGVTSDAKTVLFTDSTKHLVIAGISGGIKSVPLPAGLISAQVYYLCSKPGSTGEILLLTSKGMWVCNMNDGSMKRFSLEDPAYSDSLMDLRAMDVHPDGSWWLGVMGRGVFRYDPVQKKLRPCLWQQDGTYVGKLMTAPTTIVCDAYGVVWCGTDGAGLIKLLHNRVVFRSKYTSALVTDTCNWFIRCFYELSSDRYLVGTFRGGITLVDHRANKIERLTTGPLWENTTPFFITGSGEGRLVVGTDRSVLIIDTTTWVTEEVANSANGKFPGYLLLADGGLLIYGNTGIRRLTFSPSPVLSAPLGKQVNVTAAVELQGGRLVVSTFYAGLQEMTTGGVFVKQYPYASHVGMPEETRVRDMFTDEAGQLWLGTESGLHLLNSEFKHITTFTTAQGLSDNSIYAIERLNERTVALATGHGITLFNPGDSKCAVWGGADGLPSDECNSGALLFSRTNLLYIGTTSGFVRWNPLETRTCFRQPAVQVSYSENEPEASGLVRESIVRDYGSGAVELRIWLTDFAFPERTTFTYQLEGSGEEPITETGLRKINYAALGSGFYSFLCSAEVPGCEATNLAKLLTIKIVPPYWMSGWFIGISSMGVVLLITLILFVIMRLNYQRKIRKLKMQQELDNVRQRISRDIHDEIGAGLTRIALSGDLMSQKINSETVTEEKLRWIAGTARELSQSMKEVVWSVNPHYDSLDHMAAYFRSYVSGVAENTDMRFVYQADESLPLVEVNPEARRNLLLILKEAISNSVKYAAATELRLEIYWRNERLTMHIGDNGKGFNLHGEEKVNSNGLRNIRQRAEASGCMCSVTTAPGKGTQITISGPVARR